MKRTLNKLIRGERGQALIIVLVLMLLGGLIIAPLLSYMSTGLWTGKVVYENRMMELYAADAGVENAIYFMKTNPGFPTPVTVPTPDVNSRTLDVNIETTTDPKVYKITSTATANDKSTTIVAYVGFPPGLFDQALTTLDGDIYIENNITIGSSPDPHKGNVFAQSTDPTKGNIVAGGKTCTSLGSPYIDGKAEATGCIGPNIQSYYPKEPGHAPIDFQSLINTLKSTIIDPAKDEAQNVTPPAEPPGTITITGNWSPAAGTYNNSYHVTGNFSISSAGTVTIGGTLIVDGNFFVQNNSVGVFNGPVYVKGYATISASGGAVQNIIFNDIVRIEGHLQVIPQSATRTYTFWNNVYVGGYVRLQTGPMLIDFKGNLYAGGADQYNGYVLLLQGSNLTFRGIVYAKDEGTGRGPTNTTIKCSATTVNITGGGPIIGTNKVNFEGGNAQVTKIPLIMSEQGTGQGAILLTGTADFTVYLYAPYGEARLGGGSITGGVTAKSVYITSNSITISWKWLQLEGQGSSIPIIISWETNVAVAEE